jgi:hypothetical protein
MNQAIGNSEQPLGTFFRSAVVGALIAAAGVNASIVSLDSLELRVWTYGTMFLPIVYAVIGGIGLLLAEYGFISLRAAQNLHRAGLQMAK